MPHSASTKVAVQTVQTHAHQACPEILPAILEAALAYRVASYAVEKQRADHRRIRFPVGLADQTVKHKQLLFALLDEMVADRLRPLA
jgi:hypothetical protein